MNAVLDTRTNTLTVTNQDTGASVTANAFTGGMIDPQYGFVTQHNTAPFIPAPNGTYYITDNPNFRVDHYQWYGLLKQDDRIDDYFYQNGQRREGVRLHPGRRGSLGCVTVNSFSDYSQWDKINNLISNTSTNTIPYTAGPYPWSPTQDMTSYGTMTIK